MLPREPLFKTGRELLPETLRPLFLLVVVGLVRHFTSLCGILRSVIGLGGCGRSSGFGFIDRVEIKANLKVRVHGVPEQAVAGVVTP